MAHSPSYSNGALEREAALPQGVHNFHPVMYRPRRFRRLVGTTIGVVGIGLALSLALLLRGERTDRADLPAPSPELIQRLKECVLPVRTVFYPSEDPRGPERIEHGSCVATERAGVFLTAAHVVPFLAPSARVTVLIDGRERPARIERKGLGLDVAVLSVADYEGRVLPLANEDPKEGSPAFIAGFPVQYAGAALPQLVTTRGRITAVRQPSPLQELQQADVLQVRGATDLGGSGGALVTERGELLGLVFATRSQGREVTHVFAVPASDLKQLLVDHP